MGEHLLIDGNNLLYAMHAHAPLPHVGRETMVKIIERWAGGGDDKVTLVFDGSVPPDGLSRQMASRRIEVRFSAPYTADDILVGLIQSAKDPGMMRVVSGDRAIRHVALARRCRCTGAVEFVRELFTRPADKEATRESSSEKPRTVSPEESKQWIDLFGLDEPEPFDGHDAMI